jgi:hypothetical protein
MTAASGDSGETPPNGGGLPPQAGGYQPLPPPGSYLPPPPPGYPPLPGYAGYDYRAGHPRDMPRTNTLAIVSLMASVVSLFCVVGSAVGVVVGVVALNQIKRTHQDGRGLAVAGIALGIASLLVYLLLLNARQ